MSTLTDLITDLQTDLADETGATMVSEPNATHATRRGFVRLNADLEAAYQLSGEGAVSPAMTDAHRELWLLASEIVAVRKLRAAAARYGRFSASDMSMDRSGEAETWRKMEDDLTERYATMLARVKPSSAASDLVYRPQSAAPALFERGSDPLDPDNDDIQEVQ